MSRRAWAYTDFYAELDLTRAATAEEIAERYRQLAWELHPDRNANDTDAAERFKAVAVAYGVLHDPVARAQYDEYRNAIFDRGFAPTPNAARAPMAPAPARTWRIPTKTGIVGGIALVVLGLFATFWVIQETRHQAQARANGIAAVAVVSRVDPRAAITFEMRDGTPVTADAPVVRARRNGGYQLGERLQIRYDHQRPTSVVLDESNVARNVTLWIVAIKLMASGGVLLALTERQRRRSHQTFG